MVADFDGSPLVEVDIAVSIEKIVDDALGRLIKLVIREVARDKLHQLTFRRKGIRLFLADDAQGAALGAGCYFLLSAALGIHFFREGEFC